MTGIDRYSPAAELQARIDRARDEGVPVNSVVDYAPQRMPAIERATSLQVRELTAEFRRRSRAHRFMAFGAQILITLSIFGGIYLFGFAGQIAADERRTLVAISSDAVTATRKIRDISELELSRAQADLFVARKSLSEQNTPRNDQLLSVQLEVERLERKIAAEKSNIATSHEVEAQAMKQMNTTASSQDQTILAITTKVGSVLLLLFFVKVLVSIFRYYSRLSIFYDSRADAFASYASLAPMTLLELTSLISPDSLDFERAADAPEPPSLTLVKELASLRGKGGA